MSTWLSSVRSDPPNTAVLSLSGVSLQPERPADARSPSPLSGSPRPQSASRRLPRMRTDLARGPGHNGGLLGRAAVAGEHGGGSGEASMLGMNLLYPGTLPHVHVSPTCASNLLVSLPQQILILKNAKHNQTHLYHIYNIICNIIIIIIIRLMRSIIGSKLSC